MNNQMHCKKNSEWIHISFARILGFDLMHQQQKEFFIFKSKKDASTYKTTLFV